MIDLLIESLSDCLHRCVCKCSSHLCSCFDISIDIIRDNHES